MAKRNPYAASLRTNPQFRGKATSKTAAERVKKGDGWDREAKHKGRRDHDDPTTFQLGDDIEYEGKEGIVKNPNGPEDLIGITVDGEYSLVPADKLKIIEESLQRLRELSK